MYQSHIFINLGNSNKHYSINLLLKEILNYIMYKTGRKIMHCYREGGSIKCIKINDVWTNNKLTDLAQFITLKYNLIQ